MFTSTHSFFLDHEDTVRKLIDYGANVDIKSSENRKASYWPCDKLARNGKIVTIILVHVQKIFLYLIKFVIDHEFK